PALSLDEAHRWAAETVRLTEPVSAYENVLKTEGHTLTYEWDANLINYYQSELISGHALATAWQEVPKSAIAGMVDTIRTRVLTLALELKSEIGESDADLKKVEPNSTPKRSITL